MSWLASSELLEASRALDVRTPRVTYFDGCGVMGLEATRSPAGLRCSVIHPGQRLFVEVQSPQAKPWLVRLEAFQIGVSPGPQRWTVRDEILSVLLELVDGRGVFRLRDLVARLNSDNDLRRRWAVEKATQRMEVTSLVRLGAGCYQLPFSQAVHRRRG